MPLRDAVNTLQARLAVLHLSLVRLTDSTQAAGGGSAHNLVEQVDKSATDATGWVRKARLAARRVPAAGPEETTAALRAVQRALAELRRNEPRHLWGRALARELTRVAGSPPRRGLGWLGGWCGEAGKRVRAAAAAKRAVDVALADCLRAAPAGAGQRVQV